VNSDSHMNQFLNDYFAECDEHISALRRNMLKMEEALKRGVVERKYVDELFRSFHTIKGLSAMVGFKPVSEMAHRFESFLGAAKAGAVGWDAEKLGLLFEAVKLMEESIEASKSGKSIPSAEELFQRLEESAHVTPSAPIREGKNAKRWLFEFTPSHELAAQGINVNEVRRRLEGYGEIIQATPRVMPSGGITFEFVVIPKGEGSPSQEWAACGIKFRSVDEEPPSEVAMPVTTLTPSKILRVDISRLDEVMEIVGELIVARARLEDVVDRMDKRTPGMESLKEAMGDMARKLRDLREAIMRMRLVPIGEVFSRMQFALRDAAGAQGKKVRMELKGEETEIDKLVVEKLMDPLLHLVRNAVSHGIELPQERISSGKSEEGTIKLAASSQGEKIVVTVSDDGRGLDVDAIREEAVRQGLVSKNEKMEKETIIELLCRFGFSTKKEADTVSGRGVGLTVVKDMVDSSGGSLAVETEFGKGTCFKISLPLSLSITDAIIVSIGGQIFAVPQPAVQEIIKIHEDDISVLERHEIIPYRDGVIPLFYLNRFFCLPSEKKSIYGLVVGTGCEAVAMVVDHVISKREIVVRPISDPLVKLPGIYGATELGDGRVILIVDAIEIRRSLTRRR